MRFSLALLLSVVQGGRVARHAYHAYQQPAPVQIVQAKAPVAVEAHGQSVWGQWTECTLNVKTGKRLRYATCTQSGKDRGICQGTLQEECPGSIAPPTTTKATTTKAPTTKATTTAPTTKATTTVAPTTSAAIWGAWGAWSTCANGKVIRSRKCVHALSSVCRGRLYEEAPCGPNAVWPKVQPEAPKVQPEAPKVQPEAPKVQPEAPKVQQPAPKEGKMWGPWKPWADCKVNCQGCKQERFADCINPQMCKTWVLHQLQGCTEKATTPKAPPKEAPKAEAPKAEPVGCTLTESDKTFLEFCLKNGHGRCDVYFTKETVTKAANCFTKWSMSAESLLAFIKKYGAEGLKWI